MKSRRPSFLLLVSLLLLSSWSSTAEVVDDCESLFTVTQEWPGGTQGFLRFVLEHEVHGWMLTLEFDKQFLEFYCWYGEIVDIVDQRIVTLTNVEWDADYETGDTFEVEYQVVYEEGEERPMLATTYLDDELICGDDEGQVTLTTEDDATTTEGATSVATTTTDASDVTTTTDGGSVTTTTDGDGDVTTTTDAGDVTTTTDGVSVTTTTDGGGENPAGRYDYKEALELSMLFYEAQRSGPLPDDNRIDYRYDSALDDYIVGGYYDAGDHVKFGFPMAAMTTQLAWGAITWADGYEAAGQTEWLIKCLQWATDYFVAAHTDTEEFYGQIGDGYEDHNYWGRPEEMTMARPAFKIDAQNPGSDLAGETAAALAAASIYYGMVGEDEKGDEALEHAVQLFDLANNYRGTYVDAIPAEGFYNSWNGYNDELAWGAAWLFKATGDSSYLDLAESFYEEYGLDYTPTQFSWDDKTAGLQILLMELTGDSKYTTAVDSFVDYLLFEATRTPLGLVYLDAWGSNRHAGNVAHALFQVAALGHRQDECNEFSEGQINYILGDTGFSYMIGFGDSHPLSPHHRSSSCFDQPSTCDWDNFYMSEPNPQVLYGAVVGGPDVNDGYNDSREDYESNEVATDYNAGVQSALAALSTMYD